MTQTFTPSTSNAAPQTEAERLQTEVPGHFEPDKQTIRNILNYSKNLEVYPSAIVRQHLEYIKS